MMKTLIDSTITVVDQNYALWFTKLKNVQTYS